MKEILMKLYDITIPIRPALAVWPGDTPFAMTWNLRIEAGDAVNLSTVTMSIHTGSHADAPRHFLVDGPGADAGDLARYWGRPWLSISAAQPRSPSPTCKGSTSPPRPACSSKRWPGRTMRRFPLRCPSWRPMCPHTCTTIRWY